MSELITRTKADELIKSGVTEMSLSRYGMRSQQKLSECSALMAHVTQMKSKMFTHQTEVENRIKDLVKPRKSNIIARIFGGADETMTRDELMKKIDDLSISLVYAEREFMLSSLKLERIKEKVNPIINELREQSEVTFLLSEPQSGLDENMRKTAQVRARELMLSSEVATNLDLSLSVITSNIISSLEKVRIIQSDFLPVWEKITEGMENWENRMSELRKAAEAAKDVINPEKDDAGIENSPEP